MAREKRIPFEISAVPFYSESNMRYLEQIAHDIKTGKASFVEHDLIEEFLNRLSFQISKS